MRNRLPVEAYVEGVLAGKRGLLGKAITLVESALESDQELAEKVLSALMPHTGKSRRIGLTGVPGVGKSTFIDAFGTQLTAAGHQVAVLAVDPSSSISRGSILGDKTRMERLSRDANAFVRPSPAGTSLGGVTRKTRETILLCEAAGYDVILVETVGVGQSETAVHSMVDFFLLLMLPGAGDELQGIKKGIMEMADLIVINKADGNNIEKARISKTGYAQALRLFPPRETGWKPRVLTASGVEETGLPEIWDLVGEYFRLLMGEGRLVDLRQDQSLNWMEETIGWLLESRFAESEALQPKLQKLRELVRLGEVPPTVAARRLVNEFFS